MSFRPIPLDDMRWDDLVRVAREQLIAVSRGNWTLHAPIDPGMTILEAVAWQLEERLFRAGALPDSVWWRAIPLLDLEPPQRAGVASAVLEVHSERCHVVDRGVVARLAEHGWVEVATTHPTTPVPDLDVHVDIGGQDVTARLAEHAANHATPALPLVDADGRVDVRIELTSPSLVLAHGAWCSTYVGVDWITTASATGTEAPVGWHQGDEPVYVVAGTPSPMLGPRWGLGWQLTADGSPVTATILDGTDSLRRSGIVRWRLDDPAAAGLELTLSARSPAAWPGAEPRLRTIAVNAAAVVHRVSHRTTQETAPEALARQFTATVIAPGRCIDLDAVVGGRPLIAESVRLVVREADGLDHEWRATRSLALAAPDERCFEVDAEDSSMCFGDDIHGRCLRLAAPPRWSLWFEIGGGEVPPVPRWLPGSASELERHEQWRVGGGDTARSVTSLVGGTPATSIEEWRRRMPTRRSNRIVTPRDAVERVLGRLGSNQIARAHAEPGFDPGVPGWEVIDALTVFCVPPGRAATNEDLRREPVLDCGVRTLAASELEGARLAGQRVFATGPAFRPVDVRIQSRFSPEPEERSVVERALRRYLHPLVGGDGTGWGFGDPVAPVALAQLARSTSARVDIREIVVTVSPRAGCCGETVVDDCAPIVIERYELPWLRRIDWPSGGSTP